MRVRVFVASFVAVMLHSAGAASAAPPTILTVGHVDRHPTATWSLPMGVEATVVEVATSPATASDGYFFSENVEAFSVAQPADTSWTYRYRLDPGTYYVHVAGYDTGCGPCAVREFSGILTLVVPAPPPVAPPPPVVPPPPVTPPAPVVATPPIISASSADAGGAITVKWALPPGVSSALVQIASSSAIESTGYFDMGNQVDFAFLTPTQTTYTSAAKQKPGTYYVHVAGDQPAHGVPHIWSTIATVKVVATGNTRSAVMSSTTAFKGVTHRFVRQMAACGSFACSLRQVKSFLEAQTAFSRFVAKDTKRPAPCGSAAVALRFRLSKSQAATAALQRGILKLQNGVKQPVNALARASGFQAGKALVASRLYAAGC